MHVWVGTLNKWTVQCFSFCGILAYTPCPEIKGCESKLFSDGDKSDCFVGKCLSMRCMQTAFSKRNRTWRSYICVEFTLLNKKELGPLSSCIFSPARSDWASCLGLSTIKDSTWLSWNFMRSSKGQFSNQVYFVYIWHSNCYFWMYSSFSCYNCIDVFSSHCTCFPPPLSLPILQPHQCEWFTPSGVDHTLPIWHCGDRPLRCTDSFDGSPETTACSICIVDLMQWVISRSLPMQWRDPCSILLLFKPAQSCIRQNMSMLRSLGEKSIIPARIWQSTHQNCTLVLQRVRQENM